MNPASCRWARRKTCVCRSSSTWSLFFFVIFDLETIFIVAWAVAFEEVGWAGYAGVAIFIGILLVALVYELKSGALDWGRKSRHSEPSKYAVVENG